MASLHNHPISVGDKVYDLVHGFGSVTSASSTLMADFGGMQYAFDANGFSRRTGRQTLFFHNPVAVIPPKDKVKWDKLSSVLVAVQNAVEA